VVIGAARPADGTAVADQLRAAGLPVDDLSTAAGLALLTARCGGQLAGVVGVQALGAAGLLRSLAVAPEFRGRGLGGQLVAEAEALARARGVKDLYLLTTTAETYFARRGYTPAERGAAPAALQATGEFQSLCPASAVCLRKTL
jgi:amino-acid N-acetyltransferase